MELTAAELTVLGLIAERPMHGYDLEQTIEQRGIRQWTDIGFSSIYYLLGKLERRGFVHVTQTPASAKSRRVFAATAEGREAATRTTLALLTEARSVPHPFLVGVANLPLLAERDYTEALKARLVQVDARIAAVLATERAQAPLPPAARDVFSYSLNQMQAERSWLAERVQVSDD